MNRTCATRLFAGLFSLLMLFAACAVRAQDVSKPLLLVASPALHGPYSRTALLAVPLGNRHIGFILNRATEVKLASLYPDHAPSSKVEDPVYFGGPEASDALFAVVQGDPGKAAIRLFGDLFMTANAAVIDRIIEQTPNEARYYAGFVGWVPGELAKELDAGYWYAAEPDSSLVFSDDPAKMWEELVKRLGNGHLPKRGERSA
jgi:putative transcriptional regulator